MPAPVGQLPEAVKLVQESLAKVQTISDPNSAATVGELVASLQVALQYMSTTLQALTIYQTTGSMTVPVVPGAVAPQSAGEVSDATIQMMAMRQQLWEQRRMMWRMRQAAGGTVGGRWSRRPGATTTTTPTTTTS